MSTGWHEARRLAREAGAGRPSAVTELPLADCVGRVTASPIVSPAAVPRFDTAAMDGWVVSGAGPWRLGAPLLAGASDPGSLGPGAARQVATGAPVPIGPVAVLRSECGAEDAGWVHLDPEATAPRIGTDVRPAGEEVAPADVLVEAGAVLTPPAVALAAVCGLDALPVKASPVVDLVLTGVEVIRAGATEAGQVRDAFGPQLPALLRLAGAACGSVLSVGDDPGALLAACAGSPADLVITTGGTAAGPADHTRATLAGLGAELILDGVAMRPGHPVLLGRLPDGRLILCLPGNPLAAMVVLVTLGLPLLDAMLGRPPALLGRAVAAGRLEGRAGGVRLVAGRRTAGGFEEVRRQGPAMLRGLVDADVLAVVPPAGVASGAAVETVALPWCR